MGLFKKSGKNVKDLIQERTRLARQVIPVLQEQVRLNPADGKLHLELVKALVMAEDLDEAKAESENALLKFPVAQCQPVREVQAEIERLLTNKRSGI